MSLSLSQQTQLPPDSDDDEAAVVNGMNPALRALVIPAEDQVEDVWRRELMKWKLNYYTCVRCGRPFRELDNIGQWTCTQHAYSQMRTATPVAGDKWPCCGQRIKVDHRNDRGCVPCDHTVYHKTWDHGGDYKIPVVIFDQYFTRVRPSAILDGDEYEKSRVENGEQAMDKDFARGFAFVRRYDKAEHQARVMRVHAALTPNSNSIAVYDREQYKWRQII